MRKNYSTLRGMLVGGALALLSVSAHAVYTIQIVETGGDVVATGSGSLNMTAVSSMIGASQWAFIIPSAPWVTVGQTVGTGVDYYTMQNFVTPPNMGAGGFVTATSGSGGNVGVTPATVIVPLGYVSGTALPSSTSTWAGASLASLGLTPGSYTWSWGSGPTADSVVVNVVAASPQAVPTLGEYAMLGLASLLAMSGIAYARKRTG